MSESGLEASAKRFVALASMSTLSKAEHEEARNLMTDLRRAGISNEEISRLSAGRWSESSVKGYTKHVRPADTAAWQNTVDVLRDLIANDVSLEDVRESREVVTKLNKRGVTIDGVADFLETADSASIDVGCLIKQLRELNDEGLTPRAITEVVTLKKRLEENDFTVDSLPVLAKLTEAYGTPDTVLQAVSAYGSLSEIENEKKTADQELRQAIDQKAAAHQELAEIKRELAQEKSSLQAWQKVRDLGFNQKTLVQLAALAEEHGGIAPFIKAMKAHDEHSSIMKDIQQAKSQQASLQTAIERLDAKHSHRRTAVEMCEKLLTEYGLGLDAVATILAMARKHGEPSVVLKAIEGYGGLQAMIQREHQLDGRIEEKESLLAKLEGRCQEAMDMLDKLSGNCIAAGTEVARLESRLADSRELKLVTTLINEPAMATFNEHAPTALAMAAGLREFAEGHQRNFPNLYIIKSGLAAFVRDLNC